MIESGSQTGILHPHISIYQMLVDMNISDDPKLIGYYAGFIETIFWGRLSDQVGRKPIMLIGLFAMAISTIAFGFQKTYLGLIICRFIAGMMNGTFATGSIIGPLIGGFLASPAQNFQSIFGTWKFLIDYPYFLPCFVGGMFNFFGILLGLFVLEETLASKQKKKSAIRRRRGSEDYGSLSSSSSSSSDRDSQFDVFVPPSIGSVCTAPILILLFTFTLTHLQNVAWTAVIPLYAFTEMNDGGLGMSLRQIGFIMSVNGFALVLVQLFLFPPLQRRFGAVKIFKRSIPTFTITFMCLPLVTYLVQLKHNSSSISIGYMTLIMILRSPGVMCYPCLMMLTKASSPSPASLGTLNGMMQTCRSFAQAIGPILGSSLFALSVSEQILGGHLVWIVLALVSVLAQLCSHRIPSDRGITTKRNVQGETENENEL
ncbi:major facilitator superfamily domain-containing protein [Melampsora americana]|nr:major facilitator superfamily domain-containing protein [Melampsora americana]